MLYQRKPDRTEAWLVYHAEQAAAYVPGSRPATPDPDEEWAIEWEAADGTTLRLAGRFGDFLVRVEAGSYRVSASAVFLDRWEPSANQIGGSYG